MYCAIEKGCLRAKSENAGMAELADARDLKSRATRVAYRFETGFRHHFNTVENEEHSNLQLNIAG